MSLSLSCTKKEIVFILHTKKFFLLGHVNICVHEHHSNKNGYMYLCNCNKSQKSVPLVHCCALITIILTKQFETMQWHNKVHLYSSSSVLFSGTHKFLSSLQQEHETQTDKANVLYTGIQIFSDGMSWMLMSRM